MKTCSISYPEGDDLSLLVADAVDWAMREKGYESVLAPDLDEDVAIGIMAAPFAKRSRRILYLHAPPPSLIPGLDYFPVRTEVWVPTGDARQALLKGGIDARVVPVGTCPAWEKSPPEGPDGPPAKPFDVHVRDVELASDLRSRGLRVTDESPEDAHLFVLVKTSDEPVSDAQIGLALSRGQALLVEGDVDPRWRGVLSCRRDEIVDAASLLVRDLRVVEAMSRMGLASARANRQTIPEDL